MSTIIDTGIETLNKQLTNFIATCQGSEIKLTKDGKKCAWVKRIKRVAEGINNGELKATDKDEGKSLKERTGNKVLVILKVMAREGYKFTTQDDKGDTVEMTAQTLYDWVNQLPEGFNQIVKTLNKDLQRKATMNKSSATWTIDIDGEEFTIKFARKAITAKKAKDKKTPQIRKSKSSAQTVEIAEDEDIEENEENESENNKTNKNNNIEENDFDDSDE